MNRGGSVGTVWECEGGKGQYATGTTMVKCCLLVTGIVYQQVLTCVCS